MTVTASAPGKLILLGEYAVLDGVPALVAAVDRRATVRLEPRGDGRIRVRAADLDIDVAGRLDGPAPLWDADAATARRLHLVTQVIEAAARRADLPGFEATLSTAAFFDSPGVKLGLGSSAALTVALAAALAAHAGQRQPELPELVALHRALQGGVGSGADIGAAVTGGVSVYTTGIPGQPSPPPRREASPQPRHEPPPPPQPRSVPIVLPAALTWQVVFTGRSTSTAAMLAALATWRAANPAGYRPHLAALHQAMEAALAAAGRADTPALLAAIDSYASALDGLGAAAGLDIVSADHRRLRNLAADCGVIYKPSGAGGGDIGLAFSGDSGHSCAFRRAVSGAGYRMIDMAVDPVGSLVTNDVTNDVTNGVINGGAAHGG